jgi:beta-galactosidase/beta-glucuronidase
MGRNLSYWAPQQLVAPPLRQQISLNGTWDFTPEGQEKNEIPVPEYWDAKPGFYCDQATYQRKVSVPADWQGKRIVVAFEGVNHIADVSVNGHQLGQHLGGFVPFEFDVTSYVKTGQTFDLKVHVGGGVLEPIVDEIDKALWPVGWDGVTSQWGIIFPVWLRAYGPVYLDDTQIQTSFRNKQITVNYTITNAVHQVGRKVPDDLMHITFGNEAATTFSWPTISRLEINHSKLMQNLIRDLERIIAPPHWPVSCSISTDRRDFHGLCIRSVH